MKLLKMMVVSIFFVMLCESCKGNSLNKDNEKDNNEEKVCRVEIEQVKHAIIKVFLGEKELDKNELKSVTKGSELTIKVNSTDPSSVVYTLKINNIEYPTNTNGEFVKKHKLEEDVKITVKLGQKYYRIDFDIDVLGTATIKFEDPETGKDVKGLGFLLERNTNVDIVLKPTNPDYKCVKIVVDGEDYVQVKNGFITANVTLTKNMFAKGITERK